MMGSKIYKKSDLNNYFCYLKWVSILAIQILSAGIEYHHEHETTPVSGLMRSQWRKRNKPVGDGFAV